VKRQRPEPQAPRLDGARIERDLGTRRVGRHVLCFAEVDSTNDVALTAARQADADGLAVLAEHQRAGRGRMGRTWHSPPGANLLLSVLLTEDAGALPHEAVTIAAGLAVAEAVGETAGLAAELRWPNDVLLDGAKVAGVLVERRQVEAVRAVVIGVGLNVAAAPPPEAVRLPATYLAAHAEGPIDRGELARVLLRHLDVWVERITAGALEALHAAWIARCGMLHEWIRVRCGQEVHEGTVVDVSPMEGLLLATDAGRLVHLPAELSTLLP